ncbi:MAG: PEP-CTERM sorting domain-containing protein [Nitrosomonas sp.]|nr:MAG: PEP-CTERM sorting domain-containing protein [Nitrosomonas sp.]
MKISTLLLATTSGFLAIITGSIHAAPAYHFSFPAASASVTASAGFIDANEIGHFWSASNGDKIQQNFTDSEFYNVTGLELDLNVTSNTLTSDASVDWDVLINGMDVGDWSWSSASGIGSTHLSLSFAPVIGEFKSLALVVKNDVPVGFGSIALGLDTPGSVSGVSYSGWHALESVSAVPEPETYGMLLAGMVVLSCSVRRNRAAQTR